MKRTIIILIFLLWSVAAFGALPCFGADYYISASGDDTAAGAAATPWKHPGRAALAVTTGDTVYFTSTASTPIRGTFATSATGQTYTGGHITSAHDMSADGAYQYFAYEHWFENTTGWTTSGTVALDAVEKSNGSNCVKLTNVDSYVRRALGLTTNQFRFSIIYKNAAGKLAGWRLKNTISNNNLAADGDWDAAVGVYNTMPDSETWAIYTSPWVTGETTGSHYRLDIAETTATGDVYIDGFWVEGRAVWSVYSGTTYQTAFADGGGVDGRIFWKSSTWSANGINGLVAVTEGTDKDSLNAGEWDYASGVAYYRISTGESIGDLHFEMSTAAYPTITLGHNTATVSNMTVSGGGSGVKSTASCTISDSVLIHNQLGFYGDGATAAITDTEVSYGVGYSVAAHGEGVFVEGASDVTCTRVTSHHNGDDNFQNAGTATLNLYYCLGYEPGQTTNDGSNLEVSPAGGGAINVSNCTFHSPSTSTVAVIRDKGDVDTDSTYKNVIAYNDGSSVPFIIDIADRSGGSGSVTATNNCGYGGVSQAPFLTTNGVNADPLFMDSVNSNYRLKPNSPCRNTGDNSVWSGTASVTDIAGRSITNASGTIIAPGGTVDIGAYEYVSLDDLFFLRKRRR